MYWRKYTLGIPILLVLICSCSQNKKDAADFFLKANVELGKKNYAEALRLYDEAIAKNADFSDAYLNKGIVLLKQNKPADAYEVLTNAIKIDPTLLEANLVRSEVALTLGRLRDAKNDLAALGKAYADSSRYHLVKGDVAALENDQSTAVASYDRAIGLNPQNTEALVNRGALYYKMHDYANARQDFSSALKVDPARPQALNNMGLIEMKSGNWEKAVGYFDLVLGRTPNEPLALNNKGYALLQTGQLEEGKTLIERSLLEMPENGYALRNLGLYYSLNSNFPEALKYFQHAIETGELVEDLYGLTGQTYMALRKPADACRIWKQGIILKDFLAIAEAKKNCH